MAAAVDCRSRRHSHHRVCVSEHGDVRGLQLPGSPYWALKTYLIRRCRKHTRSGRRKNNRCPRLLKTCDSACAADPDAFEDSQHVVMLTAGQLELNNYVNTEAKYTKFAYSSRFGFTLERGRFGLKHDACDSICCWRTEMTISAVVASAKRFGWMKITFSRAGRRGATCRLRHGRSRSGSGTCACTVSTARALCKPSRAALR